METYDEFVARIQKKGPHKYHISHCLGTRDAWKWVRKNKWEALGGKPFDQLLYSKVINDVNIILSQKLLEGHEVEFPYQMGCLLLTFLPTKVRYKDGKLKSTYRTDWKKTMELWYEDEEARKNRLFVKRIQSDIYFLRYFKSKANYKNKRFYVFKPNNKYFRSIGKTAAKMRLNAAQFV